MRYVYRAVDEYGQVIDVYVSPRRDSGAARRFFHRALATAVVAPVEVVTDRAACYVQVLEEVVPGAWHGCNVTYEIDPTYTGATPLTGRTFTVIYEVTGSEYGPLINNFDVNSDGTASLKGQELTRTSSSAATLKAKATSVSED